jgi:hypothetical protein
MSSSVDQNNKESANNTKTPIKTLESRSCRVQINRNQIKGLIGDERLP